MEKTAIITGSNCKPCQKVCWQSFDKLLVALTHIFVYIHQANSTVLHESINMGTNRKLLLLSNIKWNMNQTGMDPKR